MAIKRLNAEHWIAITEFARPKKERKTAEEIAKMCGVARSTVFEWKKDPAFERELQKEILRQGNSKLPEVIENIYKVASDTENAAMAKLVLQLNGMLTDKHEVVTAQKAVDIDYDELDAELASFGERLDDDKSDTE